MAKKRNKNPKEKKQITNQVIPSFLPFKKITPIKSIHETTLNFCLLSSTNKYIIACSSSYLALLDINNFKILSKQKMDSPILYLIELSNKRILLSNAKMIFYYEVNKDLKLNLLFYYEEKNFENMGVIGAYELLNNNILIISPCVIRCYTQTKDNILNLYDTFKFETIIELKYEDYGTQFKSSFIVYKSYIALLTRKEMFIINYNEKKLVKKIDIEKNNVSFKSIKLDNDNTLIYHKKKFITFDNKYLEIINQLSIKNEKEEVTCVEKLKKDKLIAFGTNLGKIYIYDYPSMEIIKEIGFNLNNYNVVWMKELNNNLLVNNLPKGEIGFCNFDKGKYVGKLMLSNAANYRKGIFLEKENKLLIGCANSFVLFE